MAIGMPDAGAPVVVRDLCKVYRVPEREGGFGASLRSLVHRQYREVRAVDGITFSVEGGEVVGFLGPNGAGKTTTLKMLSGLLHPTSGEARVLGYQPFAPRAGLPAAHDHGDGQQEPAAVGPAGDGFPLSTR